MTSTILLEIRLDLPGVDLEVADQIREDLQQFEINHVVKPRLLKVLSEVMIPDLITKGLVKESALEEFEREQHRVIRSAKSIGGSL